MSVVPMRNTTSRMRVSISMAPLRGRRTAVSGSVPVRASARSSSEAGIEAVGSGLLGELRHGPQQLELLAQRAGQVSCRVRIAGCRGLAGGGLRDGCIERVQPLIHAAAGIGVEMSQ